MVIIVPIVAVAAIVSIAMSRRYPRRERQQQQQQPQFIQTAPTEFDARLERVAQAVDVIAAELEQISQNQRALTKALAEQKPTEKRIGGV